MKITKIKVAQDGNGKRLDIFLTLRLGSTELTTGRSGLIPSAVEGLTKHEEDKFSRSSLQRLITKGDVLVNGGVAKPNHKVKEGDLIELKITDAVKLELVPEDIPIEVLYEDDDLLVVNKPAGLVTHPAPGNYHGTLVNALLFHSAGLSGVGGVLKPGIVHRLDKGTSGILVVAKNDVAHSSLAKQFKDKTTKRVYIALVRGKVEHDNGVIELPLARSRLDRKKMAVDFSSEKNALTRFKVLKRFKDSTLLELVLGTGRTHQIRVHLAYIGHPVVGDKEYGKDSLLPRPALHAKMLGFAHPVTKKYMEFTSDIPEDMKGLIAKME